MLTLTWKQIEDGIWTGYDTANVERGAVKLNDKGGWQPFETERGFRVKRYGETPSLDIAKWVVENRYHGDRG